MSQVFVTELPEMLFDAQRADACRHRYHQNEDVFTLEKWRSLVESACQSGDLATEQGMVDIERVNDWLGWSNIGLWSVFRLHNPLLPDMEGLYDKALAEIGQGLKSRIAEADPRLERDWDNLPPAGRYKRVIVCDSLNGPKSRLFDALGDICFWAGDESGKSIHGTLVAEIESWETLVADRPSEKELRDTKLAQLEQSMRRCDAVRERLLAGVIPWSDEIGEIIDLLRQFAGEPWCYQIRFPVWLENVERIPKTSEESISGTPESDVPTAPIPLNGRCAMNRKVIFWLAPNETLIPADQVPGAIADTLYPPPERKELAGQAPNDPNAVKRLEAEREQANQLRIKFPHLKDGDKFSIGDLNDYLARHEMVAEIRQRREAVDHLDPEGRWARRQFEDGFNAVREPVVEARRSHLELSDKQCTELAGQRELFIDHWIELVGVGIGQHESYDIARDGVVFRKWEDKFISESPNEWQIDMERDNRIAPHLAFPCTPAELVEFVDNAIGIHCFGVPDAFRVAATARAQAERCNELATLPELLVHHWIELTGIGICKGGTYSVGQSGVYPKQYSDADFLCTLSPEESRLLLERAYRPPLIFPCTPSQLLKFVDGGLQGEFEVPGSFRAAVEAHGRLLKKDSGQGVVSGTPESDEPTDLVQSVMTPITSDAANKSEAPEIRKRATLIAEVVEFWPSITQDLSDATRNGLCVAKLGGKHGFWVVNTSLNWATQRGKIQKVKARSFVTGNEDSHLTPMLRALLKLD